MIPGLAYVFWAVTLLLVGRPALALRDNGLGLLSNIRMPHTFTVSEMRIMKGQLDTLRLGIDLVLSMLGNMTEADKQTTFTSMWPGIKCIFNGDFAGNGRPNYGSAPQRPQGGPAPPGGLNQQPQQSPVNAGGQQPSASQPQDQTGQQIDPNQISPANPQQPEQQPAGPSPPADPQQSSPAAQ